MGTKSTLLPFESTQVTVLPVCATDVTFWPRTGIEIQHAVNKNNAARKPLWCIIIISCRENMFA
jgi:hypothetical protein